MLQRLFYSIAKLCRYHRQLKQAVSAHQCPDATLLNFSVLSKQGITCLALDIDGVLAPHGGELDTDTEAWLQQAIAHFGIEHVFILSNKPSLRRQAYFQQHFPGVRFISGVAKKPYPDGLERIITLSGASPRNIMMVDDRIATGCLAACIAGTSLCYITQPLQDLQAKPVIERFFALLRFVERLFLFKK